MIFSQPAFLWGLLVVAVPVIVHLFNFRRYRKVYFSNVDRLSELHTESRRRSSLRELLILALRILAIVFLVLAFARPVLPRPGQQLLSGASVVSVYVDNSFSMEAAASVGSQLDVARTKARQVAAAYDPSVRFQLLSNDMSGREMRWLSRDEFLEALDQITVSPASPALSQVAARQLEFMGRTGAPNRHAFLISDFQQSVASLDALPSDSLSLLTLVPLPAVVADNIYIDTLVLDAPAYFLGGSVVAEVSLRNSGTASVEKLPVKLFIDGRERALAAVDLPAGGSAKARLSFSIDRAGWLDGTVRISDYPVTFDDDYFFTLHVGSAIRALEVYGQAPAPALSRLFASDSLVSFQSHPQSSLDISSLADLQVLFLNGVASLPSGVSQALQAWVLQGGSLVVAPPPAADVASLNALLAALGAPSLAAWSVAPVKAASVNTASPLYRNVFSSSSDEMELPTLQGRYRVYGAASNAESVIALPDGSPFLSLSRCGSGRLYLFSAPLDDRSSDFPAQALFVPTVYNMALYSRPLPPPAYTLGSSSPVLLEGSYDPSSSPVPLLGPDGFSILPDLRRVAGRSILVPHGELRKAAVYSLADEHIAFNFSRRESDLSFLSPSEVSSQAPCAVIADSGRPVDQLLRERSEGRQLWRLCLALALASLLAEALLLRKK